MNKYETAPNPVDPNAVLSRPRLVDKLHRAAIARLVLVCAPAGYGKTTLVHQWTRQSDFVSSWVTLRDRDNDFQGFWTQMLAALKPIHGGIAAQHRNISSLMDGSSHDAVLHRLNAELLRPAAESVLILDDFHYITEPSILASLSDFLEQLPCHLHLLIVTRTMPGLSLAGLRARQEIGIIGANDLKFTVSEVSSLYCKRQEMLLPDQEASRILALTDGSAANLRLWDVAMRNAPCNAGG